MLWRLAARFVTGPIAFLVAGLIDIGALLLLAALAAIRAHARPPGWTQRLFGLSEQTSRGRTSASELPPP